MPGIKKHPIWALGAARFADFYQPFIRGGHRTLAGLGCAQSHAVTDFDPAKTQPPQNACQDRRVVLGEFEIDGIASIA